MQTALSDLLQPLRTARVDAAFIELGAGGGARLSASRGAFLHLLVAGDCEIRSPAAADPIRLAAPGDYALVLDARPHLLATAGCDAPLTSDYFRTQHDHDGPPSIRFGSGRTAARTLSGPVRMDTSNPLVRALPRTLAMTQAAGRHGPVQADAIGRFQGAGATALVTVLFDLLVLHAVRSVGLPIFAAGGERPSGQLRIPLALALIGANLQRRWTLDLLAAEVGVSRSTFVAEFSQQVGQAPMAYVTAQRMKLAGQMLRSQPLSVAEVGWRIGYDSPSSFSRLFKRHFGLSPAAYQAGNADPRGPGAHRHLHWSAFLDDA